ncbi:Peptide transport system permease protein SapB, partial [Haemophilus influenzae]
YAK